MQTIKAERLRLSEYMVIKNIEFLFSLSAQAQFISWMVKGTNRLVFIIAHDNWIWGLKFDRRLGYMWHYYTEFAPGQLLKNFTSKKSIWSFTMHNIAVDTVVLLCIMGIVNVSIFHPLIKRGEGVYYSPKLWC